LKTAKNALISRSVTKLRQLQQNRHWIRVFHAKCSKNDHLDTSKSNMTADSVVGQEKV